MSDSSTSTKKKKFVFDGNNMIKHADRTKVSKKIENFKVLLRSIS